MDRIALNGLVVTGRHGVRETERQDSRPFTIDIEVETNLGPAGRSDLLGDTVDYSQLRAIAREVIEGPSRHLLEALAEEIAGRVLELGGVDRARVRVAKRPDWEGEFDSVSVTIERSRS